MNLRFTDYYRNQVLPGDCVQVMCRMGSACVDFILTDPPYLCRYRSRDGQSIANDDRDDWLEPAFAEMYRLLKPDSVCLSFYGWHVADKFIGAWRKAGFRNHLHPTQKPINILQPLIEAFCPLGGIVLDPFCGSDSTLVAARRAGRSSVGIEIDTKHCCTADLRLASADDRRSGNNRSPCGQSSGRSLRNWLRSRRVPARLRRAVREFPSGPRRPGTPGRHRWPNKAA